MGAVLTLNSGDRRWGEKRAAEPTGGDPTAACDDFETLYRRHGRGLYGTALRLLRRPEDAEESVQDVFLRFFDRRPALPAEAILPWLRRSLANACIDRLRRRRRWRESEVDETTLDMTRGASSTALDLERALGALPHRMRWIFTLHDIEGFKHREVAEMLSIEVGTSKSQLSRARAQLRALLGGGES